MTDDRPPEGTMTFWMKRVSDSDTRVVNRALTKPEVHVLYERTFTLPDDHEYHHVSIVGDEVWIDGRKVTSAVGSAVPDPTPSAD